MDKIREFLRLVEIDDEQDEEFRTDGELLDIAIDIFREMTEIKDCPFCGGKPAFENSGEQWFVYCLNCGASTAYGTEDEVVDLWNRRV